MQGPLLPSMQTATTETYDLLKQLGSSDDKVCERQESEATPPSSFLWRYLAPHFAYCEQCGRVLAKPSRGKEQLYRMQNAAAVRSAKMFQIVVQ